jgi:hypothetical protein
MNIFFKNQDLAISQIKEYCEKKFFFNFNFSHFGKILHPKKTLF